MSQFTYVNCPGLNPTTNRTLPIRQFTVTDVLSRLSSNGAADSPTLQGTSLAQLGQGTTDTTGP